MWERRLESPDRQPHGALVNERYDGHRNQAARQQANADIHCRFDHIAETSSALFGSVSKQPGSGLPGVPLTLKIVRSSPTVSI
jgi:hypothetical protein